MSGLTRVAPDKEWFIVEEHLRFPVEADVPPAMVPLVVARDLMKSIQILEQHRGWKYLEAVPSHRKFDKPCCDQIAKGRAGTPLQMRFQPSPLQADTDDAHNFGGTFSPQGDRLYKDNTIDWVAILHFWQPGIVVDPDEDREMLLAGNEAFRPDELPAELLAKTSAFDWFFNESGTSKPTPRQKKIAADSTVSQWRKFGSDGELI